MRLKRKNGRVDVQDHPFNFALQFDREDQEANDIGNASVSSPLLVEKGTASRSPPCRRWTFARRAEDSVLRERDFGQVVNTC